jgi:hypothetical protein
MLPSLFYICHNRYRIRNLTKVYILKQFILDLNENFNIC